MKIIFLALNISSAEYGGIYTDLIREFNSRGEDILVIAPAHIDSKVGLVTEFGVKVLRVRTNNLFHSNIVVKGIANVLLPYQYKLAIKKYKIAMDFDMILMQTPPIMLTNVALWIKRKTRNKARIYLILRDIFPQNAVDLNMIKKGGLLYKFFRRKERKLYDVVDEIGCMSPANIDYVIKHNKNIDPEKLHLLPNWKKLIHKVNTAVEVESGLLKMLKSKFVVLFGGNLGRPQKLENIVDLAKSVADYPEIYFFIIGQGTEKEKIAAMIADEQLTNIEIHDPIWSHEYQLLIDASDVGLISLSEDFTIPNFPSKVLAYFTSKLPVLASLDMNTDFGQMLEATNSGVWAPAGNTNMLKEKLLYLYNNREVRKQMGENGFVYMKNNLLPEHAYKIIMDKMHGGHKRIPPDGSVAIHTGSVHNQV